jgi:integrase
VEQSRQLLAACPVVCRPWLILAMFAGIRPDGELMKLDWSKIDLETATVKIDFPKVRSHRRIVPLEPLAVKLLKEHPLRSGAVAPSRSTLRRFKRRMRAVLGFERWPQDVLRHTAASYLLALHQDAAKVAGWLGNSVKVLLSNYHDPVTREASAAFWEQRLQQVFVNAIRGCDVAQAHGVALV